MLEDTAIPEPSGMASAVCRDCPFFVSTASGSVEETPRDRRGANGLPASVCGNTLAPGGVPADEASCNTPCTGNNEQACGGPNRLTLYSTGVAAPSGPSVNPGVNGYVSIGCYS